MKGIGQTKLEFQEYHAYKGMAVYGLRKKENK